MEILGMIAVGLFLLGALIAIPPAMALAVAEEAGCLEQVRTTAATRTRDGGILLLAVGVVLGIIAVYCK